MLTRSCPSTAATSASSPDFYDEMLRREKWDREFERWNPRAAQDKATAKEQEGLRRHQWDAVHLASHLGQSTGGGDGSTGASVGNATSSSSQVGTPALQRSQPQELT